MNIGTENATITNSSCDNIMLNCTQSDKTQRGNSNIDISNNSSSNKDYLLSINISVNDSETITDYDLTIKNNKRLSNLSIGDLSEESKITSIDSNFDSDLRQVDISRVSFTQEAFDSFIDSIIAITKLEGQ